MTQSKNGLCPVPFLQESLFPSTGGYVDGRLCETLVTSGKTVSCCLPCPQAAWRYTEDLINKTRISSWINVAILPLSLFLLVSYAVLPAKWTNRHYLSICFTLGICCMEIAFIIPLGSKPNECFNDITPNDMRSDLSCAFTGSFLLFGGWVVIMWSFLRTVALHLQVCWEILIGPKFMTAALVAGWGIPAIGLAIMLVLTGVSYRFGDVCHINHTNSLADYWIPLMVFAAAALFLQMATLVYCINVYVKSLFDKDATTNSSGLPSYSGSIRTATARQAYKRVRRVIQLQWRGIAIILTIIGNIIFFTVIFIKMDGTFSPSPETKKKAIAWVTCLALTKGNRKACLSEANGLGPNEATILAVLFLLSLSGFWNFIFLVRSSMITGWIELFKSLFVQRNEFVSADARPSMPDSRSYEMLSPSRKSVKSPEPVITSPGSGISTSTLRFSDSKIPNPSDHYGHDAKYTKPAYSFSAPRPPTTSHGNTAREWDPKSTYAHSTSPYD